MSRKLLAGGLVRDFRFSSVTELERYVERFEFEGVDYQEIERCEASDGSWLLRIVTAYNNTPLIDLT